MPGALEPLRCLPQSARPRKTIVANRLYLLSHELPAAEAHYHRAVGPPQNQELRVEVRVVSGR